MSAERYIDLRTTYRKVYSIAKETIYRRTRRLRTIGEVEEYFPGFKAFVDSTEQEIPRPKNKKKRKNSTTQVKRRSTQSRINIW
jgi:hypothetical protein